MKPPIVVACLLLATRTCVAAMPYWYWYATSEEIDAHESGKVPTLACPVRIFRARNIRDETEYRRHLPRGLLILLSFDELSLHHSLVPTGTLGADCDGMDARPVRTGGTDRAPV